MPGPTVLRHGLTDREDEMLEPSTSTLRFALMLTAANGFMDPYTYLTCGGVFRQCSDR